MPASAKGLRWALSDRGVLAITFSAGRPWIETKLYGLLAEASGRKPIVLYPEGEASGTPSDFDPDAFVEALYAPAG